jgi:NADH-ubiquinone oxidoreductase chain 5
MYWLVLFFPLLGYLVSSIFGRFLGNKGVIFITTSCLFLAWICSLFIFYEVALLNSVCVIKFCSWFDFGVLDVSWGFLFDSLTAMMLLIVTLISFLVHLYSTSYMENDPHIARFMTYLSLFTVFMLFLVTADNFIQMFLGWEGVGLSSYLLINFWYTRLQANKSAIKAILVNRVGDFGLIIGLSLIFVIFKSLNYFVVFPLVNLYTEDTLIFFNIPVNALTLICGFIFLGAVGKSAQIGLHTWLPDAMEGPTPVSALIHAATMVTAGVFLIIRCSPLMEYAPSILVYIAFFGACTAFFAATTGLFQNDLKKVIAYSTCSQLGYMVFACGLSNYHVGFFHLINHAYFKALLFLAAGSVIHAMSDEQDMRKMGGLLKILPFTYMMMLIGSLALMGFPFLTGFYSKDVILELTFAKYTITSAFVYWLGLISAFFTAFYSFRLLYLTFWVQTNSYRIILLKAHESSIFMCIPLFILALGSLFIGFITKDMFIGLGSNFWGTSIFNLNSNISSLNGEFMPFSIKLIPLYFSFFGAFFVYYNNYLWQKHNYYKILLKFKNVYVFLIKKWYFDIIYNKFIVSTVLNCGFFTFKEIDRGLIEIFGPLGLVKLIQILKVKFNKLQTGFLHHYAFIMVSSVTFILIIFVLLNFIYYFQFDFRFFIIYIFTILFIINNNKIFNT